MGENLEGGKGNDPMMGKEDFYGMWKKTPCEKEGVHYEVSRGQGVVQVAGGQILENKGLVVFCSRIINLDYGSRSGLGNSRPLSINIHF